MREWPHSYFHLLAKAHFAGFDSFQVTSGRKPAKKKPAVSGLFFVRVDRQLLGRHLLDWLLAFLLFGNCVHDESFRFVEN